MIYVIDHNDSFTHNVVHQFALFDRVVCDNYNEISEKKIQQSSTIVFSPGPGSPKDYPITEPPGIIALIISMLLIFFLNLPLIRLT